MPVKLAVAPVRAAAFTLSLLLGACSVATDESGSASSPSESNLGSLEQPISLYSSLTYRGVNLAAADFGEQNLPGTFGTHYTYPSPEYGYGGAAYFIAKGMN